jgi:GNAT superfamily N-acetyltransferase
MHMVDADTIWLAESDDDIRRCFPALKVLRPHLDEAGFLPQVRRQQQAGYCLLGVGQGEGAAVAAAGFRLLEFLAWGRVLYIDDFITLPEARGRGHGGRLLDWMIAKAAALGCAEVHLDSGYQRLDAHRLYLNKGFILACHHFSRKVEQPA